MLGNAQLDASKYITKESKLQLQTLSERFDKQFSDNYKKAIALYPANLDKGDTSKKIFGVSEFGWPMYFTTNNAGAAATIRTDQLYTGGNLNLDLSGDNMFIGLWEGDGVRGTHQDLNNRLIVGDFAVFLGSNDETSHATHVAGTMVSSGSNVPQSKGMAYEATLYGYDWNNDYAEMAQRASLGLLVSNHSYGIGVFDNSNNLVVPLYFFGKYNERAKDLDELLYAAPYYQPVIAAGNDRQLASSATNKAGYDMLGGYAMSKNAIVVAAVGQVNNYSSPFSVQMSNFSNYGPTDDGRIKPDISSKGLSVYSLDSDSDDDYSTKQGTSMAAPGVTGTLLLLQELYNDENSNYMKAATLKGLISHSALEAGFTDGPDYKFGWGLLNAEAAASVILNNSTSSLIVENDLLDQDIFSIDVESLGNEPLIITLAWTDPDGNVFYGTPEEMLDDPTPLLVNDLDVRVKQNSTEYFPWVLNPNQTLAGAAKGDNVVDNIEKIEINNASGNYTIEISHKGSLVNNHQNYSLIVTGINSTLSVDKNILSTFSLSPNPNNGEFTISFDSDLNNNDNVLVDIYDMSGRLVYKNSFVNEAVQFNKTINLQGVAAGVYIANISKGGNISSNKIIIE